MLAHNASEAVSIDSATRMALANDQAQPGGAGRVMSSEQTEGVTPETQVRGFEHAVESSLVR